MNTAIQVVTLIGALSTIILGVVAIGLSLYFYQLSSRLHGSLTSIVSRIEASSKTTELASRDVLQPVIETILGVVRDSTQSRLDSVGYRFVQRSAAGLEKVVAAGSAEEKEAARREFIEEINSLLGLLRHEVGKFGLAVQPEIVPSAQEFSLREPVPRPGSPSYNWTPFVRRIRDMEASYDFLSVKWLRERRFAEDPEAREALQAALDKSMLSTYFRDNPKNPQFPTRCCKLNREHPVVIEILQAIGEAIVGEG